LITATAEAPDVRDWVRSWVAANRIEDLTELVRPENHRIATLLFYGRWDAPDSPLAEAWQRWESSCVAAGFVGAAWPKPYGQGWQADQVVAAREEFAASGMPWVSRGLGEQMVGPVVLRHGTPEQKAYFLPRIVSGEDWYVQGFSEPDAGSDLAAIRTRGEVRDGEILVTGEKIWTTIGWAGNKLFVLCRTDLRSERHRGLSFVILDVDQPGVVLRRTRQMTGEWDFTDDYLDEARAPLFNVIGGLGQGWQAAMSTLESERGSLAPVQHARFAGPFWELVTHSSATYRGAAAGRRQLLADLYIRLELLRFVGQGWGIGPLSGARASLSKLMVSDYRARFGAAVDEVVGMRSVATDLSDAVGHRWGDEILVTPSVTIMSGTSEIQRNLIGERVLGLPREPVTQPPPKEVPS
jgi:alkylation response protein AidB-like acyl-CoA dehydrogenase